MAVAKLSITIYLSREQDENQILIIESIDSNEGRASLVRFLFLTWINFTNGLGRVFVIDKVQSAFLHAGTRTFKHTMTAPASVIHCEVVFMTYFTGDLLSGVSLNLCYYRHLKIITAFRAETWFFSLLMFSEFII